jgi:hypothetical protein
VEWVVAIRKRRKRRKSEEELSEKSKTGDDLIFSYFIFLAIAFVVIALAGYWVYLNRERLGANCCAMAGMTFGSVAGFAVGAAYVIPTGDYLAGNFLGVAFGIALGAILGKLGGAHGIMEGVMAGVMGGLMGAMLGYMGRIFDLQLLMLLVFVSSALMLLGYLYMVASETRKLGFAHYAAALAGLLVLSALIYSLDYSLPQNFPQTFSGGNFSSKPQEVSLKISFSGYEPNTIYAKKGVPLKITATADSNAGCARAIVFPDFGVSKIIASGSSDVIEFTPDKTGEFEFRCSMGMFRGKLVVS